MLLDATDCGYPEQSYQSTVHLEGNIASYSCNLGYLIQEADMEKRHCRADGYWSGAAPTCKRELSSFQFVATKTLFCSPPFSLPCDVSKKRSEILLREQPNLLSVRKLNENGTAV